METLCVREGSGYLAMPVVTSHTTKLVLLSLFTAHCVRFTGRCVILCEVTIEISSGVKFRGLSYPSESLGNSCAVCLVKAIPSCNSICFYFRYLPVKQQRTIAVRPQPLSAANELLKRYSGIDFSSSSLVLQLGCSWTLCGFKSGLSKAE